jgi:hypothetical protein
MLKVFKEPDKPKHFNKIKSMSEGFIGHSTAAYELQY